MKKILLITLTLLLTSCSVELTSDPRVAVNRHEMADTLIELAYYKEVATQSIMKRHNMTRAQSEQYLQGGLDLLNKQPHIKKFKAKL